MDYNQRCRFELKRSQMCLPMLSFDLWDLVSEVMQTCFPQSRPRIDISFCINNTLACVLMNEKCNDVLIHAVLNDDQTPRQVIRHIIAHEMIHLLIPKEEIDGRVVYHTEAFWQKEKEIVPERSQSWAWIYMNFHGCIRRDEKKEATFVKANLIYVFDQTKNACMRRCSVFILMPTGCRGRRLVSSIP